MLTPAELDRLYVVLVGSRNPLNIGAAARAMANFGFPRLRVVHPYDLAFREARSAVDAASVLTAAESFDELPASIADCSLIVGTTGGAGRQPDQPLCQLEAAAGLIRTHLRTGSRVALLFGSEKVGLSREDLRHCQLLLRIPTRPAQPSMNLGQAVAVVLYELVREPVPAVAPPADTAPPVATLGERERLIAVLLEVLSAGGYAHPGTGALLEEKVRRLVRRVALTPADLNEWLGLCRQILWKLQTKNAPALGSSGPSTPAEDTPPLEDRRNQP